MLGATGVESRFEAQHKTRLTPLIGRDEEIELLLRRWRHSSHEGCAIVLTGEPGIGKSHIALALESGSRPNPTSRSATSARRTTLTALCIPFIRQLERAARFERKDSAGGEIRQA